MKQIIKKIVPHFLYLRLVKFADESPLYAILTDNRVLEYLNSLKVLHFIPKVWYKIRYSDRGIFRLETSYLIAFDSPDHLYPCGTRRDNSKCNDFNKSFYNIIKELGYSKPYNILDLGCAGGGMIRTFIRDGHNAIGLEGSDYCKKRGKFEWTVIPESLFTCDIAKPFTIYDENGNIAKFDLVTAWDFLEHIKEGDDLLQVIGNIKKHLRGIFVCNISHRLSVQVENDLNLHQTVRPPKWWDSLFEDNSFEKRDDIFKKFNNNFVRKDIQSSNRVYKLKEDKRQQSSI